MATSEQKEQLMGYLKFTPRTYSITMSGYGGEVVMGRVHRKTYDYFKENNIDLDEYASSWDDTEVPEDLQPFSPGAWHECDDIVHECGVEMSLSCTVRVYDENQQEVWSHSLCPSELSESGIEVECFSEDYSDEQPDGTVVFYGQNFEKGLFFEAGLNLTEPFDPKHLKFLYSDVDGWEICNTVEYRGESLDSENYDTVGKSSSYTMVVIGGDQEPEIFDYTPDSEQEYTEYYPVIVKPVRLGVYDCVWKGNGQVYGKLEWDGVNWVNHLISARPIVKTVEKWRGLNWDTSDWSNKPVFA